MVALGYLVLVYWTFGSPQKSHEMKTTPIICGRVLLLPSTAHAAVNSWSSRCVYDGQPWFDRQVCVSKNSKQLVAELVHCYIVYKLHRIEPSSWRRVEWAAQLGVSFMIMALQPKEHNDGHTTGRKMSVLHPNLATQTAHYSYICWCWILSKLYDSLH